MNSLTHLTKQEQHQCGSVRFSYSEFAYPGHILLDISYTIRTAKDGPTTLGPCLRSR